MYSISAGSNIEHHADIEPSEERRVPSPLIICKLPLERLRMSALHPLHSRGRTFEQTRHVLRGLQKS